MSSFTLSETLFLLDRESGKKKNPVGSPTWGRTQVSQEAKGEREAWPRAETSLGFSKEGMGEAQEVGLSL